MSSNNPPAVVFCGFPVPGHTNPLIRIGQHLSANGFPCFFLAGDAFHDKISAIGAEPHSLPFLITETVMRTRAVIPVGATLIQWDLRNLFLVAAPKYAELLSALLVHVKKQHPGRKVVIIHETFFTGLLPHHMGLPLPEGYSEFPKTIALHMTGLTWQGADTAPFGLGLPPATSEEGRQKNLRLAKEHEATVLETTGYANALFTEIGCTKQLKGQVINRLLDTSDATLALLAPSVEYPRSDLDPKIQLIGSLSTAKVSDNSPYPPWWPEITSNGSLRIDDPKRKKVVFVSQGTIAMDYSELVHPTIRGLEGRQDVIVIAALGKEGAQLGFDLPETSNAKVIDYLPYEWILPYTDVFVFNGGYGGFMHGVMSGVPMIAAGLGEDKAETAARIEWSGVGVNLKTQTPAPEVVAKSVDEVLGNDRYRKRVTEIKEENDGMDALAKIEQTVLQLAR